MSLDLDTRTGWPDELRLLLDRFPRVVWPDHVNLGQVARFWLDIHDGCDDHSRCRRRRRKHRPQ